PQNRYADLAFEGRENVVKQHEQKQAKQASYKISVYKSAGSEKIIKNSSAKIKDHHIPQQMPEAFVQKHVRDNSPGFAQQRTDIRWSCEPVNHVENLGLGQCFNQQENFDHQENGNVDQNEFPNHIALAVNA